jgi:hypothetical protein
MFNKKMFKYYTVFRTTEREHWRIVNIDYEPNTADNVIKLIDLLSDHVEEPVILYSWVRLNG